MRLTKLRFAQQYEYINQKKHYCKSLTTISRKRQNLAVNMY